MGGTVGGIFLTDYAEEYEQNSSTLKGHQPASLLPWMGQIFHDDLNNVVLKHLPPLPQAEN